MRIFLIYGILLFCFLIVGVLLYEYQPRSEITQQHQSMMTEIPQKLNLPLVDEINVQNSRVRNYFCDSVKIKTWERGMRFLLDGRISYEKPSNFRMELSSPFGQELDIGSNGSTFWYWSRRDKKPGLYYASYADYSRTRLKTPFNPTFLRRSLGLDEITTEGATARETDTTLMLSYNEVNGTGEPVVFSILIDKDLKVCKGCVLSDSSGRILATSEVRERVAHYPTKLLFMWYEEDRLLSMDLSGAKTGDQLSESLWELPNYRPMINMADELSSF